MMRMAVPKCLWRAVFSPCICLGRSFYSTQISSLPSDVFADVRALQTLWVSISCWLELAHAHLEDGFSQSFCFHQDGTPQNLISMPICSRANVDCLYFCSVLLPILNVNLFASYKFLFCFLKQWGKRLLWSDADSKPPKMLWYATDVHDALHDFKKVTWHDSRRYMTPAMQ